METPRELTSDLKPSKMAKNEGWSHDLIENKGPKKASPFYPTMFMKTSGLTPILGFRFWIARCQSLPHDPMIRSLDHPMPA
jgi:hypothetical protein